MADYAPKAAQPGHAVSEGAGTAPQASPATGSRANTVPGELSGGPLLQDKSFLQRVAQTFRQSANGIFEGSLEVATFVTWARRLSDLPVLESAQGAAGTLLVRLDLGKGELTARGPLQFASTSDAQLASGAVRIDAAQLLVTKRSVQLAFDRASFANVVLPSSRARIAQLALVRGAWHYTNQDGLLSGKGIEGHGVGVGEAHATGIQFPGAPTTDIHLTDLAAGTTTDSKLLDLLSRWIGPSAAPGTAPTTPLFPPDAQLIVESRAPQLTAVNEQRQAQATLLAPASALRLMQHGKPLASIELEDVRGELRGKSATGHIGTLRLRGEPGLIRSLAQSEQAKQIPLLADALAFARRIGIQPTIGGESTLTNIDIGLQGAKLAIGASGNVDLKLPHGYQLAIAMVHASSELGTDETTARFERMVMVLRDQRGQIVASATALQTSTTAQAGTANTNFGGLEVNGDLDALVRALDVALADAPANTKAAIAAVRGLPFKGNIKGSARATTRPDGSTTILGDFSVQLQGDAGLLVDASIKGVRADVGSQTSTRIASLTAKLKTPKGKVRSTLVATDLRVDALAAASEIQLAALQLTGGAEAVQQLVTTLRTRGGASSNYGNALATIVENLPLQGNVTAKNLRASVGAGGIAAVTIGRAEDVITTPVGQLRIVADAIDHDAKANRRTRFSKASAMLTNNGGEVASLTIVNGEGTQTNDGVAARAKQIQLRGDGDAMHAAVSELLRHKRVHGTTADVLEWMSAHGYFQGRATMLSIDQAATGGATLLRGDVTHERDVPGGRLRAKVNGLAFVKGGLHFDAAEFSLQAGETTTSARATKGNVRYGATTTIGSFATSGDPQQLEQLLLPAAELPDALVRVLTALRDNGVTQSTGAVSANGVQWDAKERQLSGRGSLNTQLQIAEGTLHADVDGVVLSGDRSASRVAMTLQKDGKPLAELHASNVVERADGTITIGSLTTSGDADLLRNIIGRRTQLGAPSWLITTLDLIASSQFVAAASNVSIGTDLRAGSATYRGNVRFVADGASYVGTGVELALRDVRYVRDAQLGGGAKATRDGETLVASSVAIAGDMTRTADGQAIAGLLQVHTGPARLRMEHDQVVEVELERGRVAGHFSTHAAPGPAPALSDAGTAEQANGATPEPSGKAAMLRDVAAVVQSADIQTSTPIRAGRYGGLLKAEVAPDTRMNVRLVVEQNQVTGATSVVFTPEIGLPLWLTLRGVNLQAVGAAGALRLELGGFFDWDITKLATGHSSLALRLPELLAQLTRNMATAVGSAASSDPSITDFLTKGLDLAGTTGEAHATLRTSRGTSVAHAQVAAGQNMVFDLEQLETKLAGGMLATNGVAGQVSGPPAAGASASKGANGAAGAAAIFNIDALTVDHLSWKK